VAPGSLVVHSPSEFHENENGPQRTLLFRALWVVVSTTLWRLRANRPVVGTFDASPIDPHSFASLLDGTCTERDLSVECIRPPRTNEVVKHWCVSSLTARGSMAERMAILGALSRGLVERLDRLTEVGWPSRWCAVAPSHEGGRLLERAGFRCNRDDLAVMVRDLNSAEDLRAFRGHFAAAARAFGAVL
jgi:hypothetical protein